MTLRIDTTRALRTHHSHVELVKAIVGAFDSTQETHAVEWKTTVDLSKKLWRARLAKGVLGFANRDPGVVNQWFEGCAYLVAGASPGKLLGTTPLDSAKVEDALAAYLGRGPAGPEWSSSYVDVDGKSVLILTVECPRMGSGIWTFKREFTAEGEAPIREGTIFVRHQASTEQATSADIEMLTRRAASGGTRLGGLSVVLTEGFAAPIDVSEETLGAWLDAERTSLALPPEPPGGREINYVPSDPANRKTLTVEDIMKAANLSSSFGRAFVGTETRSREKYQAEVDAYLSKVRGTLPGVLMRSVIRRGLGRIAFSLRNDTPDNFHAVEVDLTISASGAAAYFEPEDVRGSPMPKRPIAWGKGGSSLLGPLTALRTPTYIPPALPNISRRRGRIDNRHSSRIPLDAVDVRPKRSAELDEFDLLVHPDYAGKAITVAWTATATNASGDMEGTVEVPVRASVPTVAELLDETSLDDDGDFGDDE